MSRADTWAALDAFALSPSRGTLQVAIGAVLVDLDVTLTREWVGWVLALSPAALDVLHILPTTRTP